MNRSINHNGSLNGHRKAVLYTRVSTARQAAEGVSIDAQLAQGRAWAKAMDYKIVGQHIDAGISGSRADNRPGLQEALDQACREQAALIVYSLSRLARSTKDALSIAEQLDKAGADLVSWRENIDTTSAAGKMVFRILAVLSEFERDLVSERTRAALAHKRQNGFKTGGAHAPFGYQVDGEGRLVEDPDEQKVIKTIRRLRGRGRSLRDIGIELERRGVTTRTGSTWNPKTVKGGLDRVNGG